MDIDIGDEAVNIANEIEAVLSGHTTAASYLAIGMVLGQAEARAEHPNLDRLLAIIRKVAVQQIEGH